MQTEIDTAEVDVDHVPRGQLVHWSMEVAPSAFDHVPASHALQLEAPSNSCHVPALQGTHEVAPEMLEYVPPPQLPQTFEVEAPSKADHVLVESMEFVPCTLPLWRVAYKQLEYLK